MALPKKSNMQMFSYLFVGYMMIVYVRQAVSYSAPVIGKSEHLDDSDLGIIISSQMMGYTILKFFGGTLADIVDGGLTFVVCLLLSGLCGITFTAFSSVTSFAVIWFICGIAQGPAWSACAVLLKKHFPSSQLATWWSILSTSSNVAGTAGPFISQVIVSAYNWRTSFVLSGLTSIIVAIVSTNFFVALHRREKEHGKSPSQSKKDAGDKSFNIRLLYNPLMLFICIVYMLVTVIRGACNDWGQLYLIHNKEQSLLLGSTFVSTQEIGGIVGSIAAGYISDKIMSQSKHPSSSRPLLIVLLTLLQTTALYCLIFHVGSHSSQVWINLLSFLIGFGVYGAISLIGIVAIESAPDQLSGTAHSFAALAGNLGRVISGYPLSLVATHFSWHEGFITALFVSVLSVAASVVLLTIMRSKYTKGEKEKSS